MRSPIYHVFDLYANHTGRTVLDAALRAEDAEAREVFSADVAVRVTGRPEPAPRVVKDVPYLDAIATAGADAGGRFVAIAAVNRHPDRSARLRCDLTSFRPRSLDVHVLTGPDPLQENTPQAPDAVVPGRAAATRRGRRPLRSTCPPARSRSCSGGRRRALGRVAPRPPGRSGAGAAPDRPSERAASRRAPVGCDGASSPAAQST